MATSSSLLNSVKELSESTGSSTISLPSVYITRCPTASAAEIVASQEIPTIDFSLLTCGTPDERLRILHQLGRACEEWGCFRIINHGVSEDIQRAMLEAYAAFFNMTAEEKSAYKMKLLFDPICYGTSYNLIKQDVRYWRDYLRTLVQPIFHSPDKPHNFRLISEEFSRNTREVAKELLRAICESLGLERNYMEEALNLKSCHQILVGSFYPPCPQPELAQGIPPHSDADLLTLIMDNNTYTGLQVMHDGNWVPVEHIPNSLFVMLADLLELFSNGRYKSILHRSLVNDKSARISALTSFGPPMESVVIAPAPKLIHSRRNASPAFRGITYKQYIELHQRNQLNKHSLTTLAL